MYLEYLKGSCETKTGTLCEYCSINQRRCPDLHHVPRPYPDDANAISFHYLSEKETPSTNRSVDEFHPGVQIKKSFAQDKAFFDNPNNITAFSKKYVLGEELIQTYVDHLKVIELRRNKQAKEKRKQAELESKRTYHDYNWTEMFLNGSLTKLKNAVLDKFIIYHNLGKCSNKKERLDAITILSPQEENDEFEDRESGCCYSNVTDDENSEEFILEELGIYDQEQDNEGELGENPELFHVYTRSGRMATRLQIFLSLYEARLYFYYLA